MNLAIEQDEQTAMKFIEDMGLYGHSGLYGQRCEGAKENETLIYLGRLNKSPLNRRGLAAIVLYYFIDNILFSDIMLCSFGAECFVRCREFRLLECETI